MRLSEQIVNEVGRLLNGTDHPEQSAITHLAVAAGRAAESIVYLAKIDDERFQGIWPVDDLDNDTIDEAHVRWAAATALTSLDLCIASASRLAGFSRRPPQREDSIRDFYSIKGDGSIKDRRNLVCTPWREWIDAVVGDDRYNALLRVRNTLIHADALRIVHGTTGLMQGHDLRFGYNVGPLCPPVHAETHLTITSREVIELSRDVSIEHVSEFAARLEELCR